MEYQLPDMKLAEPVDDDLKEALQEMFAQDHKTKGKRKRQKKKDSEMSVTNTSSSVFDDTLDASVVTNNTDQVLSDVISMEDDKKKVLIPGQKRPQRQGIKVSRRQQPKVGRKGSNLVRQIKTQIRQ